MEAAKEGRVKYAPFQSGLEIYRPNRGPEDVLAEGEGEVGGEGLEKVKPARFGR